LLGVKEPPFFGVMLKDVPVSCSRGIAITTILYVANRAKASVPVPDAQILLMFM